MIDSPRRWSHVFFFRISLFFVFKANAKRTCRQPLVMPFPCFSHATAASSFKSCRKKHKKTRTIQKFEHMTNKCIKNQGLLKSVRSSCHYNKKSPYAKFNSHFSKIHTKENHYVIHAKFEIQQVAGTVVL